MSFGWAICIAVNNWGQAGGSYYTVGLVCHSSLKDPDSGSRIITLVKICPSFEIIWCRVSPTDSRPLSAQPSVSLMHQFSDTLPSFFITFPCSLYIVQWTLSMCTIVHVYTIVYTLQNAPIPWHSKDCWHKKAHKLKSDHNVPKLLDFAGDSVYWLLQPLTVDIVTLSRIT